METGDLCEDTNDVEDGHGDHREHDGAGNVALGVLGLFTQVGRALETREEEHTVEHAEENTGPVLGRAVRAKAGADVVQAAGLDNHVEREEEDHRN